MSIRTRLTLWYAGILFVSLLAMGLISYHEFVVEPRNAARQPTEPPDAASDEQSVAEGISIVLWCGVPAAVLALVGGLWFMHKVLAPVAALTRAAEAVNERNLGVWTAARKRWRWCNSTFSQNRPKRTYNGQTMGCRSNDWPGHRMTALPNDSWSSSPITLRLRMVRKIAAPGKTQAHHSPVVMLWDPV